MIKTRGVVLLSVWISGDPLVLANDTYKVLKSNKVKKLRINTAPSFTSNTESSGITETGIIHQWVALTLEMRQDSDSMVYSVSQTLKAILPSEFLNSTHYKVLEKHNSELQVIPLTKLSLFTKSLKIFRLTPMKGYAESITPIALSPVNSSAIPAYQSQLTGIFQVFWF